MQTGMEEIKLSLFIDDILCHVENPKKSIFKNPIVSLEKLLNVRSIYKKQLQFYILAINNWK